MNKRIISLLLAFLVSISNLPVYAGSISRAEENEISYTDGEGIDGEDLEDLKDNSKEEDEKDSEREEVDDTEEEDDGLEEADESKELEDGNLEEDVETEDEDLEDLDDGSEDLEDNNDMIKDKKDSDIEGGEESVESFEQDGFTFTRVDGGLRLDKYTGPRDQDIIIPAEIEGEKIVEIGDGENSIIKLKYREEIVGDIIIEAEDIRINKLGLSGLKFKDEYVEGEFSSALSESYSIVFQNAIESLGDYAFEEVDLETIEFPKDMSGVSIGKDIFRNSEMNSLEIPYNFRISDNSEKTNLIGPKKINRLIVNEAIDKSLVKTLFKGSNKGLNISLDIGPQAFTKDYLGLDGVIVKRMIVNPFIKKINLNSIKGLKVTDEIFFLTDSLEVEGGDLEDVLDELFDGIEEYKIFVHNGSDLGAYIESKSNEKETWNGGIKYYYKGKGELLNFLDFDVVLNKIQNSEGDNEKTYIYPEYESGSGNSNELSFTAKYNSNNINVLMVLKDYNLEFEIEDLYTSEQLRSDSHDYTIDLEYDMEKFKEDYAWLNFDFESMEAKKVGDDKIELKLGEFLDNDFLATYTGQSNFKLPIKFKLDDIEISDLELQRQMDIEYKLVTRMNYGGEEIEVELDPIKINMDNIEIEEDPVNHEQETYFDTINYYFIDERNLENIGKLDIRKLNLLLYDIDWSLEYGLEEDNIKDIEDFRIFLYEDLFRLYDNENEYYHVYSYKNEDDMIISRGISKLDDGDDSGLENDYVEKIIEGTEYKDLEIKGDDRKNIVRDHIFSSVDEDIISNIKGIYLSDEDIVSRYLEYKKDGKLGSENPINTVAFKEFKDLDEIYDLEAYKNMLRINNDRILIVYEGSETMEVNYKVRYVEVDESGNEVKVLDLKEEKAPVGNSLTLRAKDFEGYELIGDREEELIVSSNESENIVTFKYRKPEKPEEPEKPVDPKPEEPEKPVDPKPEEPEKPVDPKPEEPEKPVEPEIEKPVVPKPEKPEDKIEYELNLDDHMEYIQGYPDGSVRPENNISREEVAAVFYRILNPEFQKEIRVETSKFPDIPLDRWSQKHIGSLNNVEIMKGYEDGNFRYDQDITRAEVAAVVARYRLESYDGEDIFNDIDGHWAQGYINEVANSGWLKGYEDGSFRPDQKITRAELVTIVNDLLSRSVKKENILEGIKKYSDLKEDKWYYEDFTEASNGHDFERLDSMDEKWIKLRNFNLDM